MLMENTTKNEISKITVDFKTFEKVYQTARKAKLKEVTFEFIIASCFPDIAENIKQELRRQHACGYIEGLQAAGVQQIQVSEDKVRYKKNNKIYKRKAEE